MPYGILTALFVWVSRFVATAFPLTLSLSRKGRGNPRTASSYKCKPLYIPHSTLRIPHSARTPALHVHVKDTHGLSFSGAAHDRLDLPRAGGEGESTRRPIMPGPGRLGDYGGGADVISCRGER